VEDIGYAYQPGTYRYRYIPYIPVIMKRTTEEQNGKEDGEWFLRSTLYLPVV
jgi:hypothetical protein